MAPLDYNETEAEARAKARARARAQETTKSNPKPADKELVEEEFGVMMHTK